MSGSSAGRPTAVRPCRFCSRQIGCFGSNLKRHEAACPRQGWPLSQRRRDLVSQAASLGYDVEFMEYCEDAETPGMLGAIGGCVVEHRKAIKVSLYSRTEEDICDILKHEIDHVLGVAVEGEQVGNVGKCGGRRNAWGEKVPEPK
jgi:hypothetical protein